MLPFFASLPIPSLSLLRLYFSSLSAYPTYMQIPEQRGKLPRGSGQGSAHKTYSVHFEAKAKCPVIGNFFRQFLSKPSTKIAAAGLKFLLHRFTSYDVYIPAACMEQYIEIFGQSPNWILVRNCTHARTHTRMRTHRLWLGVVCVGDSASTHALQPAYIYTVSQKTSRL